MSENSSKNNILKKIKQALATPVPVPFPQSDFNQNFFKKSKKEIEIEFAENFSAIQGRFSFCNDIKELNEQLEKLILNRGWKNIFCSESDLRSKLVAHGINIDYSNDLSSCDASITSCESLIARTGSIVLSSTIANGRTASVYAPVHICIANTRQVVYDIKDVLKKFNASDVSNFPSLLSFATGPSRTADIEKTLVTGVHGPKEVFCFLVDV